MCEVNEPKEFLNHNELKFLLPSFESRGSNLLTFLTIAAISLLAAISGASVLIKVCLGMLSPDFVMIVVNGLLLIVGGFFAVRSFHIFNGNCQASSNDIRRVMLVCRAYPLAQHIYNSLKHHGLTLSKGMACDIYRLGMTGQLEQLSDSFFNIPREATS